VIYLNVKERVTKFKKESSISVKELMKYETLKEKLSECFKYPRFEIYDNGDIIKYNEDSEIKLVFPSKI
jgi:hypothetical protein